MASSTHCSSAFLHLNEFLQALHLPYLLFYIDYIILNDELNGLMFLTTLLLSKKTISANVTLGGSSGNMGNHFLSVH